MSDIPHAVLSEHFQDRLADRRLVSAVFLTYRFDPGFFEQEVLPVFLDVPVSHAVAIRLIQLEDALRALPGHVAVYYDASGLVSETGSAKLDVQCIPVRNRTGIFHPKNVFLLAEAKEPDDAGHRQRLLLVASLSANLTRAGWWENVEACHVEEILEGAATRLKDDVIGFLEELRRRVRSERDHAAVADILQFLRTTEQRSKRSSEGHLHTHFYRGGEEVADFIDRVAAEAVRETYLEILSPYLDAAGESRPLRRLIERFRPRETRVLLPRGPQGEAGCTPELYDWVRGLPNVSWGHLSAGFLRYGKGKDAKERTVHAKLYRFFTSQPKREVLFVGSANLTWPAHQVGGNVETGFLVEIEPAHRPGFWLSPDDRRPREFAPAEETEGQTTGGATRLELRYHWDREQTEAFWDDTHASPGLRIESQGREIATLTAVSPREWTDLGPEVAIRLADALRATSFVTVTEDGQHPVTILVREDGMFRKPSLLFDLSASDILRYWSLLTPEQRSAFIEQRMPDISLLEGGADLVTVVRQTTNEDGLFDRFWGIFHAFGGLERQVRQALAVGNEREATYRLFGRKYDSMGALLDRVGRDDEAWGDVERYVVALSAKQLCSELQKAEPEFWERHATEAREIDERVDDTCRVFRERIGARAPDVMHAFLDWFDSWFVRRAAPLQEHP